ncbi:site-2 protease family protein [Burkholderiaceae bacterium DAT-1]|nr:site-2 protease family protein [Burkholderiaceae bacterium DAT-1]
MDAAIEKLLILALPIIFAITMQQAVQAYVANYFGDRTPAMSGRLTFNPAKHIDIVGTLVVPAICIMLGGILFGWAKPVPIDFRNLRNPKKSIIWIEAAGPLACLAMAILWTLMLKASTYMGGNAYQVPLSLMSEAGMQVNVVLMVLNLIPIPPLAGGRILIAWLPTHLALKLAKLEPWGMILVVVLMMLHILQIVMVPIIIVLLTLLKALV